MNLIEGIITAISPLHIGSGRSKGTFIKTLDYIPGRTIRGMLGYYLFKNDEQLFKSSGINEDIDISKMGVFVKNAYPVGGNDLIVFSPHWFNWCKKCGKLFEKNDSECKNIVNNRPCLHEGKKYQGFILFISISKKELEVPKIQLKQIVTKCPITRNGHASMGGAERGYELGPYHIEGIKTGEKFRFKMLVRDELTDKILESLKNAGIFYGLGGFRSRGYGSIIFNNIEKSNLETKIKKREMEISMMKSKLLVMNSQMILRKGDETIIGFDTFKEYASRTLQLLGSNGNIDVEQDDAKISSSIAAGWSLKHRNSLSELIPCIGPGSCVRISGDSLAIAALEFYGVGEMINCGYGDVYIIGDTT